MWHVYRVELYPHYGSGPGTGILSPAGYERLFPAAFRHHRLTDEEKGIVKVVPIALVISLAKMEAHDAPNETTAPLPL